MSRDDWEQAISRAVVERSFRARLLTSPADALADYGLSEHDAVTVDALRANSLAEFVGRVLRASTGPFGSHLVFAAQDCDTQ